MTLQMRVWGFALVSMALFGQFQGDRFSSLPAFSVDQDRSIDIKALEIKHSGQDAVYIERISDYENVVVESMTKGYDWNLYQTEYAKRVVFNPENEIYSTITIEVPRNHELTKASFSILTAGGRFRQFGLSDLKEARNSDGSAVFKFAFPEVTKGCIITETYALRRLYCLQDSPLNYLIPLQFGIPCERVGFRIAYPYGWEMGIKKIGENAALPVAIQKDKKADRTIMTYSAENISAIRAEPFSPFYKEVAAYAEIHVLKLNMRADQHFPISYKAPKDWSELSDRCRKYLIDRNAVFSRRVEQKAREITTGCGTNFEKLDAIITWLQLNMKSVSYLETEAIGLDDGNFANNLEQKKGTVTQITGLALSMLQEVNIESKYLLLHSAKDGYFDSDFHSFSQLDVPAVLAKIDGKTYVVFPYRWRMPVDFVPEEFHGQKALAVDRKGKPEFIQIPMGSQSDNETLESYVLTLQEDGKIRIVEERVLRGAPAYNARLRLAGLSRRETERELKQMITFSEGKVLLNNHSFVDLQDYRKPLKIQMEYDLENLIVITPDEVIFNTGGLFTPLSRANLKDTAKDRQNSIRIYFSETVRKNITMNVPEKWMQATRLEDFKLENRFGTIQGTYRSSSGMLTGEQLLTLKTASASKDAYADLLDLTGKKTRHSIHSIVFKIKP